MSDVEKHSFSLSKHRNVLINGLLVPNSKVVEFLESGRDQMENQKVEIERLRSALEQISECDSVSGEDAREMRNIAKQALEGKG